MNGRAQLIAAHKMRALALTAGKFTPTVVRAAKDKFPFFAWSCNVVFYKGRGLFYQLGISDGMGYTAVVGVPIRSEVTVTGAMAFGSGHGEALAKQYGQLADLCCAGKGLEIYRRMKELQTPPPEAKVVRT